MPLPGYLRSGEKIEARELRTTDRAALNSTLARPGDIFDGISSNDKILSAPSARVERNLLAGGRERLERELDASCEPQLQDFWCWAAVTTSLSKFYDQESTWTQCEVANRQLGTNNCCGPDASTSTCNRVQRLDQALKITANYGSHQPFDGVGDEPPMAFDDVRAQIDSGRVVCSRVSWDDGSGHFQMIIGWKVIGGNEYITISDPIYDKTEISFSDFASRYQGGGKWNVAYVTVPSQTGATLVGGGGLAQRTPANPLVASASHGVSKSDAVKSINVSNAIYRQILGDEIAADSIELYGG